MSEQRFFGVDAGTSNVKAVAFDAAGDVVASASRSTSTVVRHPGWAEQDVAAIVAAVGETVREITAAAGPPSLLAVTAQGDGCWLLDAEGNGARPGVLWSDGRAGDIAAAWERDGVSGAAFRRNGNVPFAGCAAAILAWHQQHDPGALAASATAGYPNDAIRQLFTGLRAIDPTDASLPFLDVRSRQVDPELLRLYGLADQARLMAPVSSWPTPILPLTARGAALSGLAEGTPVHVGPLDFPASLVGSGVRAPGDGLISFGTTLGTGVVVDRVDTSGDPSGMTVCLPWPEQWVRIMPSMAGTLALNWLLPLLGATQADLDPMLAASPPGAKGALALPFVTPSGERAPFVDATARGRIVGLSTDHDRADLVRAVCEGIAYAARHCLDAAGLAPGGTVTISGGGGRSTQLQQLLASVLGRPLRIARGPEPGARGAVVIARMARGDAFDIDSWTRDAGVIPPDPAQVAFYDRGYARYRDEVARARGAWAGAS
jgi:erythritol kinase